MKLLAVLVGDDGAARGSGIGSNLGSGVRVRVAKRGPSKTEERETYHNAAVIYASNDGCSCAGGFG